MTAVRKPDALALDPGARRVPMLTVGMVVWLASETMFFAALFAMYFTLRSADRPWPPHGVHLDVALATIFTVVLIASSGTMQWAVRDLRRGDVAGMQRWTVVTMILGAIFLANQIREYVTVDFSISSHAYGSAFWVTTGFHSLHVLAGLVLMLVILGRATSTSFGADDLPAFENVSYYWHFVDVVWVALYSTIFLLK
jgi:cytochrome c oxidase subunit 3